MKAVYAIFVAAALVLPFLSGAQGQGFFIGAEAGAGPAWLNGSAVGRQLARAGGTAGLFAHYGFKKIVSLRTGLYYDLKGSAYNSKLTDATGIITGEVRGWQSFNYATIPLLLRATFGKDVNYFINTGPYLSLLMKQRQYDPTRDYDYTRFYHKDDVGILLGIGLSYAVERMVFSMEVRSATGLTNVSAIKTSYKATVKTNAINMLFGVAYKLGKKSTAPASGA